MSNERSGLWVHREGTILRSPRTKYKRSKNVFAVIFTALTIGCDWPRLLQPLAHSLIGVPTPSVPGLPIRDCTRGCNNHGQSRPMMSALHVTAKTFFERLYLVLGLRKIAPSLCTRKPDRSFPNYSSIYVQFFSTNGHSCFCSSSSSMVDSQRCTLSAVGAERFSEKRRSSFEL